MKGNFNNQMVADSRGRVWGANIFKGITSFDPGTDRASFYPFSEAETKLFSANQGVSITELNGRIWMITPWSLSVFDEERKKFIPHSGSLWNRPNALVFLQEEDR